ncbi:oxidoreductase (plasmid) [Fulvitalea axinellae]|uniref:Oxidoreductase n=1 Tax=Fulvitalea axinellae TaxID=1182444 RepID=A0AAU9DA86_9BACT|nr:oxidoreductase [Fulvitalea axinellae]
MANNEKPLVIITGASSGIGMATAKLFSDNGYPLLLLARRKGHMEELNLPNTICAEVDVTDADSLVKAIAKAEEQYGPADLLVNNAGVMLLGEVHKQDPAEWQKMFDVNVMGLLNGVKAVIGGMVQRNTGTIVNISSIAGKKSFPNHAAYCGTKFAVHGMTECIREEVADKNVRLTTVAPGAVETELLGHTTDKGIVEGYEDWKKQIGGAMHTDDVARAIWFAYSQPQNVCIREIAMAATGQSA